MKYGIQTLFSTISSFSVVTVFYLVSIFIIKEIKQDVWHVLLNIIIIILTLILNFIFGYFFASKMLKYGFIVQFVILLLLTAIICFYENTFINYIGAFVNPLYWYTKNTVWIFNAVLSDNILVKCIISVFTALLPSLSMYLGSRISKH